MSITTINHNSLEYLVAENISAPHGFTTRLGGVSTGYLESLNLGINRGDDPENVRENYRRLAKAVGFDLTKLVLTHQIHSDIVRVVTEADCLDSVSHKDYPECDALVTNTPDVALMVFSADCTPILFHDPVTGAVGAAHAGWRGTANGIAAKTVDAMASAFGCRRENIRAAIGPNIGFCCFLTDRDVPDAIIAEFGAEAEAFIRKTGKKYQVDLKAVNAFALCRAGVGNIEISDDCTMCQPNRFWSHRVTGINRGSQGAVIVCKGVLDDK